MPVSKAEQRVADSSMDMQATRRGSCIVSDDQARDMSDSSNAELIERCHELTEAQDVDIDIDIFNTTYTYHVCAR
jgi:hypothetical protein